jgi:hypothetical protein
MSRVEDDEEIETRKRERASGIGTTVKAAAREIARQRLADRKRRLATGQWPGYCASIMSLQHPGRWLAVVMLNVMPNRYRRRTSLETFATSEEAYVAAERWLHRERRDW